MRFLRLTLSTLLVHGALALRDAEAEQHCQRFLTSPNTAPISPTATRVLEVDDKAEVYCRRVLEDPTLPLQIKGVVLEGLTYVLEQQSVMGLASREAEAMALHQEMVMAFPDSARFLHRAASYAYETMHQPEEAAQALKARVNDVVDTEAGEKGMAKRLLARLQVELGELEDAAVTLVEVLEQNPADFHSADVLTELIETQLDTVDGLETPEGEKRDGAAAAEAALQASAQRYEQVAELATSDYSGFTPPNAEWTPQRLTFLPTAELFETFVTKRVGGGGGGGGAVDQ